MLLLLLDPDASVHALERNLRRSKSALKGKRKQKRERNFESEVRSVLDSPIGLQEELNHQAYHTTNKRFASLVATSS